MLDEQDNDRDHAAKEQAEMSAGRGQIRLQETVDAEENDEEEWMNLTGRLMATRMSRGCFFHVRVATRHM